MGSRLSDDQMLRLTGFVMALPTMTPARYRDLAGLDQPRAEPAPDVPGPGEQIPGDSIRGVLAIQVHACRTCHVILGIPGAKDLRVGPPLAPAGVRRYIAGTLPNRPGNMIRWLMAPQQVDPLSAMPDTDLSRQQAPDIAVYLYTLSEPPNRVTP